MSTEATLNLDMRVTEIIEAIEGRDSASFIHRMSRFLTPGATYGGATTIPISKAWSGTVTLSGGAGTLDLTALPNADELEDVTLNGLTVQFWGIAGAVGNADPISVQGGASNPYELEGDANGFIQVYPGMVKYGFSTTQEDLAAVSGTVKEIDFAGTGSEQAFVIIAAG